MQFLSEWTRDVATGKWKILEALLAAGGYRNPRWVLEISDGRLSIRRISGTVVLDVCIQHIADTVRLGPVQVSTTAVGLEPASTARIASELVDDALREGELFFEDVAFAVVGDIHGQMGLMETILHEEEKRLGRELDFVLQVGDFMPVRGQDDLATVYAPRRCKVVGDFPAYHQGVKRFPWPVYFVGGNHEPYGFLETLEAEAAEVGYARVADNLFYFGRAGWLTQLGVNVVGLSGTFAEGSHRGERPVQVTPASARDFCHFNEGDLRNVWYTFDSVFDATASELDIVLLHDWPAGLVPEEELLAMDRRYGHLRDSSLLRWACALPPARFVCCGHHHVRRVFRAGETGPVVLCLADITQGREAVAVFRKQAGSLSLSSL